MREPTGVLYLEVHEQDTAGFCSEGSWLYQRPWYSPSVPDIGEDVCYSEEYSPTRVKRRMWLIDGTIEITLLSFQVCSGPDDSRRAKLANGSYRAAWVPSESGDIHKVLLEAGWQVLIRGDKHKGDD